MLLPLFLNNLLGAFRLVVDAGVYEVAGTDVNFRIWFPLILGKQGGAAAMVSSVSRVSPSIIFGSSSSDFDLIEPEIVTVRVARRSRPTIVTVRRTRKP